MAVSDVSIANYALQLVGGDAITAIDDNTTNGTRVNDLYEYLRDDLLRGHAWNFATKFVQLSENATAPTFDYDNAFDLPSDWLRSISVHDNDAGSGVLDYQLIEVNSTRVIATSAEQVYLKYVYQHTTETRWPADFVMAFQLALARDLAIPVANSNTLHDKLEQRATRALMRAKSADALQNPPPKRPQGSWAAARFGWPSNRWPR